MRRPARGERGRRGRVRHPHVQGTQAWLRDVGAPLGVGWHTVVLTQRATDTLDAVTAQVAAPGLLATGAVDLAAVDLAAARLSDTVSPNVVPSPRRRAAYWAHRGRALTRVPPCARSAKRSRSATTPSAVSCAEWPIARASANPPE
ncbi:hypothetical protein ACOBQX_10800 [Actinokineospora sp. G85]|uniref:hypothetical protein n=1 Tax=Actinokineospora sp. G85 TaxID=3406626 RepID=UPI003C728A85